jgi:neutral ceramidase
MKFSAGFGCQEITCFMPGIGMMGYGQPHNTVEEVGTPLLARAMFLQDEDKKSFILVHLEQAFVSLAIKEEILARLSTEFYSWNITDANLLITAQHTHSAPGGYSHYPFYNFTIPGLQLKVLNTICEGIIGAIKSAYQNLEPVTIFWGQHTISEDKEVGFNRSLQAYLNNPDVSHLTEENRHLAINRRMEGLMIRNQLGVDKGFINWFGVHCTSVTSFNHRIHHDNKGVAAALYEKAHPGTMAFFMQEAAGDVSPNFIWEPSKKMFRGKFKDQYDSASYNGELQFRESEKIQTSFEIKGNIQCAHEFVDMAKEVAPAAHGIAFFEGTTDGPGIPKFLAETLRAVTKFVRAKQLIKNADQNKAFYAAHSPKDILLDHRTGSFLGIPLNIWKRLPPLPDTTVEAFRKSAANDSLKTLPWVPSILPMQLICIGPLAVIAVPGEITTTAAARLKKQMVLDLQKAGIDHVIISSYANAYMGYITTPEEYAKQSYEAGHTIFGHGTLGGFLKGFRHLAEVIQNKKQHSQTITKPFHFPAEELAKRTFS